MARSFGPVDAAAMSPRQRWLALLVLAASLLVVVMDMTILIVALPDLVAEIAPSATEQLWIVDAYSLVLAGLLIPMSALADRWGRRRILLIGFAIFGAMSALVLVVDAPGQVIALRAVLGIGGAMIMPTTLSLIRTIFRDPLERARALAIWAVVAGVGAVLGPLVGGALLQFFSWHAAFLINVPFVLVAIVAGLVLLPEARDPAPPRWDLPATGLSIAGMVTLVWGIKELAKHGLDDPRSWAILVVGALLLAVFVRRCLSRPDPLLDVRLFRSRPFGAGTLSVLMLSIALSGMLLLVAQWLQSVGGYSPIVAGAALLPMVLGSFAVAPLAPLLALRIGARAVLAGGLAIVGLGMVSLIAVDELTSYWQLVAPLTLVGVGSAPLAVASAIIMGSTPEERAGNAAAIEESMYDIGNVLGIAVLGSIAAALYRAQLDVQRFAEESLTRTQLAAADDSIVGALALAEQTGSTALAATAATAFGDGLTQASFIGGVLLLLGAAAVYLLAPRDLSIGDGHDG